MRHTFPVVAAVAALSSVAAAQVPAPSRDAAPILASGSAIMLGRVVEADTDGGVGGAVVTLSGPSLGPPASTFDNGVPGGSRRVAADGDGRFVFRDLPAGSYSLGATAPGYVAGEYGARRPIAIRRTLDLVRRVEIADREKVTADIRLWRFGGIGGAVFDDAGEPVVGIAVTVLARMTDWGGPVMQVTQTATTDDRGMYHVDVTPGDYLVAVLAATTTVPGSASEQFDSARREGGAAFKKYMEGVSSGGGLLPRGIGTRIGSHLVHQLSILNVPAVPTFFTGPDNVARFFPTTFHPAARAATAATLVSVGSGEEKAGIDVLVSPIPMRRVSGRITGPPEIVSGLAVTLIAGDPAVTRTSPATVIDTPQALTDSTGLFTFYGVPPGAYTLRASRTSGTDGWLWWAIEPFTMGDEDIDDVDVTLRGGTRIRGKVVADAAATAALPDLRTVVITPRPLPGSPGSMLTTANQRPDPAGAFTTREMVPGPHVMSVTGLPPGWVLKSIATRGQDAVDRPFDLTTSGIDDMVVTLTNRVSTLAGVVHDENGRPAPAATVAVFPADKSLWRLPGIASRRVQTAAPGRDGRYSFRGLPAGDYYVVAVDWPAADFSDGQVLTKLIPSASRVTLADGGSASRDLRVEVIR